MKRPASWFLREIQKQTKRDPKSPIRFDISLLEAHETISKVLEVLVLGNGVGKPALWRYYSSHHIDPKCIALRKERVGFFPPTYPWPKPTEVRPILWRGGNIKKKRSNAFKQVESLRKKYGPNFHVEVYGTSRNDIPLDNKCVIRVWKGEDWLAARYAMFYPAEIAKYLGEQNFGFIQMEHAIRELERPARAGVKMFKAQAQRRAIKSQQCHKAWDEYQSWIEMMRMPGPHGIWSLKKAQKEAAKHFKVHPRTIRRHTKDIVTN